jgi:hypothetical protein
LCHWVFQFAELQPVPWWTWQSAILAVEFHIPQFQALLWLHVDSIKKRILKSQNNECIKYKVEHSDSVQKWQDSHNLMYICTVSVLFSALLITSSYLKKTVSKKIWHWRCHLFACHLFKQLNNLLRFNVI